VDVDEEAVLTGEPVEADDLRHGGEVVKRGRDPGVRGTQSDNGVDVAPHPAGVDDGPVAGDDPGPLESSDPGRDCGLRQADPPADLGDAEASLALQDGQDREVYRVQCIKGLDGHLPSIHRLSPWSPDYCPIVAADGFNPVRPVGKM
jgi:hypothetical protein